MHIGWTRPEILYGRCNVPMRGLVLPGHISTRHTGLCFSDLHPYNSTNETVQNITKYEDMIDHRSYTHNLSSCEIKAKI